MNNLKNIFFDNYLKFTDKSDKIQHFWNETVFYYSEKNRFYHNLTHIKKIIDLIIENKKVVSDLEALIFSAFYHDIIYLPFRKDNEKASAILLENHLSKLQIPQKIIKKSYFQIIATKTHIKSSDFETNFFLDCDLSILGENSIIYNEYTKNIRKEYKFIPIEKYKIGRKKVLEHFLKMDFIYKTNFFRTKYEKQARNNINCELIFLTNQNHML